MAGNVAEIEIKTINNTGKGLDDVSTNFKKLDNQIQNLEKNLKPLKTILDGGLAVSGSVAGIASLTKNSGNLSGAVADLKSSLLGIQGAADNAGGSLGGFFGGVTEKVYAVSAAFTKYIGIVRGAVEVGQKIATAYQAIKTVMAEVNAVTEAAALAKTAATAATTTETVAETADAVAKTTTTTVTTAETTAVVASATAKIENTAVTAAETVAETAGAMAKGAGVGPT